MISPFPEFPDSSASDHTQDAEHVVVIPRANLPKYPDELWGPVPVAQLLRKKLHDRWLGLPFLPNGAEVNPNSVTDLRQVLEKSTRIWNFITDRVGLYGWIALGVRFPQSRRELGGLYRNDLLDEWFSIDAEPWRTIVRCNTPHSGDTITNQTPEKLLKSLGMCEHHMYAPFPPTQEAFTEYARNNTLHSRPYSTLMHIDSSTLVYVYHSGMDIFCKTPEQQGALAQELAQAELI